MDCSFTIIVEPAFRGSELLVVAVGFVPTVAEHRPGVVHVNVRAGAKQLLQLVIVSFPCHNLGVGAREVSVEYRIARVWDEDLLDVRELGDARVYLDCQVTAPLSGWSYKGPIRPNQLCRDQDANH